MTIQRSSTYVLEIGSHKEFKYLEQADYIVYRYQRRWRDFSKCYWGGDYHNEHNHPDLPRSVLLAPDLIGENALTKEKLCPTGCARHYKR
jgi:hypothetical protein